MARQLIRSEFLASEDPSRKVIGYVYLSDYYTLAKNEEEKIRALEHAKKLARQTKNPVDMAYVNLGYARYYQNLKKTDLFIKSINDAVNVFSRYQNENFMLAILYFLKNRYKVQNALEGDYRSDAINAKNYALKSGNNVLINFTYSNLGYYYKKKFNDTEDRKYLDSARISYSNSLKYCDLIENYDARKKGYAVYYLNYGSLMNAMYPDDQEKILKLYNTALNSIGNSPKLTEISTSIYNNIGSVYENLENTVMAKQYYDKAYVLSKDNADINPAAKLTILNNLSRINEGQHNLAAALEYEREAKNLINEDSDKRYSENIQALELFYQVENKNNTIEQLKKTNILYNRQKFLYLAVAVLFLIGIAFLYFLFRSRQKIHEQKIELLKREQEIFTIQQEQLAKETLAASLQLDYKNHLIKGLGEKIKESRGDSDPEIDKILKEDKLSDRDFENIQSVIKRIHPGFFKKLSELSRTKLSSQDLKYAAYIYLNMDNQQIANILKVDPKTVRVTKYRLKQKMGLGKEEDLKIFIQNIVTK